MKNATIKIYVNSKMKEEIDNLIKNVFGKDYKLQDGYLSIIDLGLQTLNTAILNKSIIKIEWVIPKQINKIIFVKGGKEVK